MSVELYSYELTDFNLVGSIRLDGKLGLVKIHRAPDGKLVLLREIRYTTKSTHQLNRLGDALDLLSFIMDVGIRAERELTFGAGHYSGRPMPNSRSVSPVTQSGFAIEQLEQYDQVIQAAFQSSSRRETSWALKMSSLLQTYNNAQLLYPSFPSESYLNLMRILDAIFHQSDQVQGSLDFALRAAEVSIDLNNRIYKRICKIGSYKDRVTAAKTQARQIEDRFTQAKKKARVKSLNAAGKFVLVCMHSAYEYRNKYIHVGFPLPRSIIDMFHGGEKSGMRYLSPVLGISISKTVDFQDEGIVDQHEALGDDLIAHRFREERFVLLPTWYFLKELTREAISVELRTRIDQSK